MDLNDPPTTTQQTAVPADSNSSSVWNNNGSKGGSNGNGSASKSSGLQSQVQQSQQQIFNGKINRSGDGNEENDLSMKNSDAAKRKKIKQQRNSTVPPHSASQKDLDEWLESCLKDAAGPQLSSSSEFLDYNTSSFSTNKKTSPQQQLYTKSQVPPQNSINYYFQKLQAAQGLPGYHHYNHQPFNFTKMQSHSHHMQNDPNLEFASLPPIVNYGPNGESNSNDNIDSINDPTRSLRFSDPCLVAPSDTDSKLSDKNSPDGNQIASNKLLATLLEQINLLHETNSKICRNLHETKVEIEAIKHAPSWGLRHRRDSLSGLSTHSQPLGFAFGTQSPAPTYHSGMYTPGAMTDVVREVKEAARVREEALLSRVKAMVEERTWATAEGNIRMMRDIEELKAQIQHLRGDRKESNKRIAQLETENKYIRSILSSVLNNRTSDIIHENELLRSTPIRKNCIDLRQKHQANRQSLNLNYGTINYEDSFSTLGNNDRSTVQKSISLDAVKLEQMKLQDHSNSYSMSDQHQQNGGVPYRMVENTFHSSSSHDGMIRGNSGGGVGGGDSTGVSNCTVIGGGGGSDGDHLLQIQNDTIDLRRELQDAIASKKQAENRIIALENMVQRLRVKSEGESPLPAAANAATASAVRHHSEGQMNGLTKTTGVTVDYATNSNSHNLSPSQMSTKLSLAGPITDL